VTSLPVRLASGLVRLWTRFYTAGLPAVAREARVGEIESDLWESAHDPAHPPPGAQAVVARLLLGLPDDLRWRAARTSIGGLAVLSAALAGAGVVAAWLYVNVLSPQTLPQPHGRPMHFVSDRPAVPPPPPPPPPAPPKPR
jgi:hypothetical protein